MNPSKPPLIYEKNFRFHQIAPNLFELTDGSDVLKNAHNPKNINNRLPSPKSPTYYKAHSFRAHSTQHKDKVSIPFSSRKILNSPACSENKEMEPKKNRNTNYSGKFIVKSPNFSKTQTEFRDKRLSLDPKEEEIPKNNYFLQRNVRIVSEKTDKNFISCCDGERKKEPLKISKFDENLKNTKLCNRNLNKNKNLIVGESFSSEQKNNKTTDKFNEEKKQEILNNQNKLMRFDQNMEFKTKKKEFFLNNIINMMSNKMLRKCSSRMEDKKNPIVKGKENEISCDEKIEKRQTKIYQYILDH